MHLQVEKIVLSVNFSGLISKQYFGEILTLYVIVFTFLIQHFFNFFFADLHARSLQLKSS